MIVYNNFRMNNNWQNQKGNKKRHFILLYKWDQTREKVIGEITYKHFGIVYTYITYTFIDKELRKTVVI